MTIQFMEPFSRAWKRMTLALFKPFDIHKRSKSLILFL
jgi:hypothetical protein